MRGTYKHRSIWALPLLVLGTTGHTSVPDTGYPFAVGEDLKYSAVLGYIPIGTAELTVPRVVKVRDADTYVLNLVAEGGPPGFAVKYQLTSWVGTQQFTSRRFDRIITQNGTTEKHRFEILPDSGRYREVGSPAEYMTPRDALDELALLYYLRFAPLTVGQTFTLARHFQASVNPITVSVKGRESVPVGSGGKQPCLATEVTFLGKLTQVWFTDDARRIPVQFTVPLPYGSVTLVLQAIPPSN
ncbi:MAG TPA: DUF3108 domain-containing protein [Gemmatimonadales bacterium]|jgi:hypothetical protein|nr:DUF3108 domain-containing protein [Gemmatimonadales bacterium]